MVKLKVPKAKRVEHGLPAGVALVAVSSWAIPAEPSKIGLWFAQGDGGSRRWPATVEREDVRKWAAAAGNPLPPG